MSYNSDQILDGIEEIAQTSSSNQKKVVLASHMDDEQFVRVMKLTFDPFITFGVRPMKLAGEGDATFDDNDEEVWGVFDKLSSRELAGNEARDVIQRVMTGLTAKSADLFWRVLNKDARAGFSESSVNKVKKGTIPEFSYMRCSLPKHVKLETWPWAESGVISQEKADGMFLNIDFEKLDEDAAGLVTFTSRQGSPFPMHEFEKLATEIEAMFAANTQSHGELLVRQDGVILAREIGNGILNSILQGGSFEANQEPVLFVWDQIPIGEATTKNVFELPYKKRLAMLVRQLQSRQQDVVKVIPTRIVKSLEEAYVHYRDLLAKGKEGTIIKRPDAVWKDGTSKEQVKLKLEADCELKVVGFEPGKGKNEATFGSIICESACGQLRVSVAGITDALRLEIHANRETWLGRIITVRSNSIMNPSASSTLHSLFLPRFVEARLDKSEADCLERIRDQFANAVAAA